ncbi:hypothetical protein ACFXGA_22430 [Actinosynnema sp. NPDC059335]|uniref:hypothetical protein n=1 Tax=Actinosynnema sp. NPDC059335 TaxID=3346804 RepID=UPI00366A8FD4
MPRWSSPWWTAVAASAPAVLLVWASAPPGGYFVLTVLALACWGAVGLAWLLTSTVAVPALPLPRRRHVARLWPFLLAPALSAASLTAAGGDVAHRFAFDAHRAALEAVVAEAVTAPERPIRDRRVGLFTVDVSTDAANGCTLLAVEDAGLLNETGWAHCPDRAPVSAGVDGYKYRPSGGPWYTYVFDW